MSPGDVLRHNAAMAKANGRPQSSGVSTSSHRQYLNHVVDVSWIRTMWQARLPQLAGKMRLLTLKRHTTDRQ